jgi:hypothetical protein
LTDEMRLEEALDYARAWSEIVVAMSHSKRGQYAPRSRAKMITAPSPRVPSAPAAERRAILVDVLAEGFTGMLLARRPAGDASSPPPTGPTPNEEGR